MDRKSKAADPEPGRGGAPGAALPPVIVVAGPTASGKSALAVDIAVGCDGVIINADSMQIYEDLPILTARPGPDEMARAPHRLFGILAADDPASAGRWLALARAEIDLAHAGGRLPIVAGGTGLYLKALTEGLDAMPPVPPEVRAAAAERRAALGPEAFHAELALVDPALASRLAPGDRQRVLRGWEVFEATGRPLSAWQSGAAAEPSPYRFRTFALMPPREALYAACDARFEAMVAGGALDEARAFLARGLDPELPLMKAVGLRELGRHLAGEIDLPTAIAEGQRATRRYAKRQYTWLRHQLVGAEHLNEQYSESLATRIFKKIRQFC